MTSMRMKLLACVLLLIPLALAGCSTSVPTRSPTRVDVQQEIGFTITEQARIAGNLRDEYQQALAMLEQGQHERGIALLEAVATAAPQVSAPRIDLGIAYHRSGNLEAAERNLLLALEINPDHPVALNELGIVYRKAGRFAEARQSYQAALEIYPGYHYARRNLAVVCDLYLADHGCALENYDAYLATVDGDEEASMWAADLRIRTGQAED